MKNILTPLFFLTTLFAHSQTIYTIPWATQQPKFVFPVYFEEATGMLDTVYYCYDPNANLFSHGTSDSVFGQSLRFVDTTKFYAFIASYDFCNAAPLQCDSQYKVTISPLGGGSNPRFPYDWTNVGFRNGKLPLKISWDISTLYSDSLPFVFNPGLPHAQGRISPSASNPFIGVRENGFWDNTNLPYYSLVTDSGSPGFQDSCTAFQINGLGSDNVEEFWFRLFFEEWTGVITGTSDLVKKNVCRIFPNPATQNFYFEVTDLQTEGIIEILDLSGRIIVSKIVNAGSFLIPLQIHAPAGLYIFKFSCSQFGFIDRITISP